MTAPQKPLRDSGLRRLADPIAETESLLLASCRENGIRVSGDRRVSERDAARLLDRSPSTLRHMREEGRAPRAYRVAGRIGYTLLDLARWIEAHKEEI